MSHDPYADPIKPTLTLAERQAREDLKWLMAHPAGRRICWRLLVQAGLLAETFHSNALIMARGEGRRSVALELLDQVKAQRPNALVEMMKEACTDDPATEQPYSPP